MRISGRHTRLLPVCGGVLLLTAVCPRASGSGNGGISFVSGRNVVAFGLDGVARIAETKLTRFECVLVFSDFRDTEGRLLSERLVKRGMTAQEYFRRLSFYDGVAERLCGQPRVQAATVRGVPAVAICTERFNVLSRNDPGLAADVLIHEMLHGLGLGENPPASEEITRRVVSRCGR